MMVRSLWFKLSMAFTLLTMLGITVLAVVPTLIINNIAFIKIVPPTAIEEIVRSKQSHLAETLATLAPTGGGRWSNAVYQARSSP